MEQPILDSAIPEVLENREILERIEKTLGEMKRSVKDIKDTLRKVKNNTDYILSRSR